jgi:hypothetical protein
MKRLLALYLWLAAGTLLAQLPAKVDSRSGQFVVRGPRPGELRYLPTDPVSGHNYLRLDASLAAVSAERIKESLLALLGFTDRWQAISTSGAPSAGRINLLIRPGVNSRIVVVPMRMRAGWDYSIELPSELEGTRFVEAIVQVLLLELANQNSGGESIELPRWFNDGLVLQLARTSLRNITLEPNTFADQVQISIDPLAGMRERLRNFPALNFEELSWPANLTGARAAMFPDCAQLFVNELLQLPDGPACFREMILQLPKHRNWQFAFLGGFKSHFQQLIDVEKWWALRLASFTGRNPASIWSMEESWRAFESALNISARMHVAANLLPRQSDLTLQRVVFEWDYARQKITLQNVINELRALHTHSAPEVIQIVDEYRAALEMYLQKRDSVGRPSLKKGEPPSTVLVVKNSARQQLDRLDRERLALGRKLFSAEKATAKNAAQ